MVCDSPLLLINSVRYRHPVQPDPVSSWPCCLLRCRAHITHAASFSGGSARRLPDTLLIIANRTIGTEAAGMRRVENRRFGPRFRIAPQLRHAAAPRCRRRNRPAPTTDRPVCSGSPAAAQCLPVAVAEFALFQLLQQTVEIAIVLTQFLRL